MCLFAAGMNGFLKAEFSNMWTATLQNKKSFKRPISKFLFFICTKDGDDKNAIVILGRENIPPFSNFPPTYLHFVNSIINMDLVVAALQVKIQNS